MIRALVLTSLVLFGSLSNAIEKQKVSRFDSSEVFYTLVGEGDHFYVSGILEERGKLPVKLWQRTFAELNRAQEVYDQQPGQVYTSLQRDINAKQAIEVMDVELWPVTQSWSDAWEVKYKEWVEANVDRNFMVTNNIQTDCADVAYSLRWIFSRIHGLPAVNKLATGTMFSHRSMSSEWRNLPTNSDWRQDRRFLAALDYLLDLTYTHTLEADSYQLKIDTNVVIPGAHFLYIFGDTGHTLFLYRKFEGLNGEDPIRMIASTVPRRVRTLSEYPFYERAQPEEAGFMKMRWPKLDSQGRWVLTSRTAMANYSLEQYDPEVLEGRDFLEFVFDRLAPNRRIDPRTRIGNLANQIFGLFEERVEVVAEGYEICFPDRCPVGSEEYENWGTPSRDARIMSRIQAALDFVNLNPNLRSYWESILTSESIYIYADGIYQELTLARLVQIWQARGYSSNPNETIQRRWGL